MECTRSFSVCFVSQPDESEVFSMSGLADSLSLDDDFGGGFMDMVCTRLLWAVTLTLYAVAAVRYQFT